MLALSCQFLVNSQIAYYLEILTTECLLCFSSYTVRGYNPASEEMRGNLMDTNMEQETIRELSLRKQVFA